MLPHLLLINLYYKEKLSPCHWKKKLKSREASLQTVMDGSPEVVLARRTMWAQAGAAALCGGDPTVNRTALGFGAVPTGGARTTPQAPAGATTKGLQKVTLL